MDKNQKTKTCNFNFSWIIITSKSNAQFGWESWELNTLQIRGLWCELLLIRWPVSSSNEHKQLLNYPIINYPVWISWTWCPVSSCVSIYLCTYSDTGPDAVMLMQFNSIRHDYMYVCVQLCFHFAFVQLNCIALLLMQWDLWPFDVIEIEWLSSSFVNHINLYVQHKAPLLLLDEERNQTYRYIIL